MADPSLVDIGSLAQVALRLFDLVSHIERADNARLKVDRAYMLDLYAECLQAAEGKRPIPAQAPTGSNIRHIAPNSSR